MKNIMIVLILALVGYGVWNYMEVNSDKQSEIDKAKQELGIDKEDTQDETGEDTDSETNSGADNMIDETFDDMKNDIDQALEDNKPVETKQTFEIESLTTQQFLELNTMSETDLADMKIELTGKTLANVDSIRVLYSNADSNFPDDDFTLKKFQSGDSSFLYRAFKEYQVFDYGTNVYTFVAKSGENESKLQLTIYYPDPTKVEKQESVSQDETKKSSDLSLHSDSKINIQALPKGSNYGNPVKVSESTVSYSDISGLEISAMKNSGFTCSNEYILSQADNFDLGIIWWNSCAEIANDTAISFYILSVNNGEYRYAKHYVSDNFYGILELESQSVENFDSLETISEKNDWLKAKNNELKEKNDSYSLIEITDNLFTEIIK